MLATWFKLMADVTQVGLKSQHVIGLRLMKLASGGPAAHLEIQRMITEKVVAFAEAGTTLAMGGSGAKVVRRLRTHVHANQRRLSKSRTKRRS